MHRTPTPRRRSRNRTSAPPRLPLAIALAGALAGSFFLAGGVLGRTADTPDERTLTLLGPAPGAFAPEAEHVLAWEADSRASEYVVFVSTSPLTGRSADELLTDASVSRHVTTGRSVTLQEIVRGEPGETQWHWVVAARDRESGTLRLSRVSDFRSVKRFVGAERREEPLVRPAGRGSVPVTPYADGHLIHLRSGGSFDPVTDGLPAAPAGLAGAPLAPGAAGGFLVQLDGPVTPAERARIEAAGARIVAYVPRYAFWVRMSESERDAVENLGFVRWTGAYEPAWKLSPQAEMSETSGNQTLVVLLYPDADLAAERAALTAAGATVLEATDSGRNKILRAEVEMSRLAEIAVRPDVAWIEPWRELTMENANAQWVVQTNQLNVRRVWDMGLRGQGQTVHTSDSGIRTSHVMFRDDTVPIPTFGQYPTHRKVIAYEPTVQGGNILFGDHNGASYHGTHTAGTIVGNDEPFGVDTRDGMAPDAKIYFHDGGANSNSITAPADLNLLFQPAYDGNAGGGARISSNSWSAATNGEYTVLDMSADQFMYDHKDFLAFFSTGNSGAPATVGSPATNKNGVGSGATQNGSNANLMMALTSQGPTQDGRTKPTILAPGQSLSSASGAGDNSYQSLTGTSMSCPSKAGATTLIRQYFTDGWYPTGTPVPANAFTPSAALLKAMAISSTDNDMTGFNVPNTTTGWGRINVDNVLYFPGDAERTAVVDESEGVATGEFVEYEIHVSDPGVPLKVTLCWTDKEGTPGATFQIVNDLDLVVTDPTATVYRGNVFAAGESVSGGAADAINVEEGVRRNAPAAGIWTVRVEGTNVPFGPQPFALSINGGIGENAGLVLIDKTVYGRDDLIEIRVEDVNAVSPITVNVSSTTESTPDAISIPGGDGVFTTTVPTTALAAMSGDGQLSVSHGDAIVVSYDDASPVGTVQAAATADFDGPVITGVGAAPQGASQSIVWTTDVFATSRVYFGTTPALGQVSAPDPTRVIAHQVLIDGLLPETTYFFDVESEDASGNVTRDDAGGAHYKFTTGRQGDILVVYGDLTFPVEKQALYETALANRGWDASFLSGGTIAHPPVGDLGSGMRSFAAIWWQVGQEQYPPFEDSARESLAAYLDGGGRLSVVSHDVAWAFHDPGSGFHSAAREQWTRDYLHFDWLEDPLTWPVIQGIAADPISGDYVAGLAYSPHREGAAGDEIAIEAGTGTGAFVWRNTDGTPDNIALRWENGVPNGNPADALWGGTPTKVVTNCLEWAQITDAAAREDILDKTLIWLIGRDHPDALVGSPNGGETMTGNTVAITWSEAAFGGTSVDETSLWYSDDDGASWNLITDAPGPSPFAWDVSAIPNGTQYRVRAIVLDDGTPQLRGSDVSDAVFTIDRPGGDTRGPVVVAGTIVSNPNPMDNTTTATLSATLTDEGRGGADVAAAEWSWGPAPAPAGSGEPMTGSFDSPTVAVSATIPSLTVPTGERTFWVRGRDANDTWGPAASREFVVNGNPTVAVEDGPALVFALHPNVPNPFAPATTIRFTLPREGEAELVVYNLRGEKVRTLVSGRQEAGHRSIVWDGRDDGGRRLGAGVYFYRLDASGHQATRKMVLVP